MCHTASFVRTKDAREAIGLHAFRAPEWTNPLSCRDLCVMTGHSGWEANVYNERSAIEPSRGQS
ncbi:hypothetical protein [Kibdelosporangium philippinense]|uniref:hypothetical protein n=1 Tax=Kibdelosporangium philippinense TaxID=211113 RepID=UPI003622DC56